MGLSTGKEPAHAPVLKNTTRERKIKGRIAAAVMDVIITSAFRTEAGTAACNELGSNHPRLFHKSDKNHAASLIIEVYSDVPK